MTWGAIADFPLLPLFRHSKPTNKANFWGEMVPISEIVRPFDGTMTRITNIHPHLTYNKQTGNLKHQRRIDMRNLTLDVEKWDTKNAISKDASRLKSS